MGAVLVAVVIMMASCSKVDTDVLLESGKGENDLRVISGCDGTWQRTARLDRFVPTRTEQLVAHSSDSAHH